MNKKFIIESYGKKYEIYDVVLRHTNDRKIVRGKIKCGSKTGNFIYDTFEGDFNTNYNEGSDEDIYEVLQEFGQKYFHESFEDNKYLFMIE